MTYSEIKTACQTLYGNFVSSGGFVESDSGNPSELALLLHLMHGRIVGYPNEDFSFCQVTVTITSTGATTYNLKTLYPDFLTLIQVYGVNTNVEHQYYGNAEGNLTTLEGWTIKNGVLTFTGTVPSAGSTFKIQYKSQYLVESSAGVRKRYFTEEDDVSVLSEADTGVIIFGIGAYVNWKSDEASSEKRKETKDWFQEAWTNMLLRKEVSRPLTSFL